MGDEKYHDGEDIVVANGGSQFEILRIAQSDVVNYRLVTEDLIKKLTEYNRKHDIDIFHAETGHNWSPNNPRLILASPSSWFFELHRFFRIITSYATSYVDLHARG